MADAARHTRFLVKRLEEIGQDTKHASGETFARGELPLSPTPFQTLERPFVISKARFYTLGHQKLKFHEPEVFFDLPAVDIARARTVADLESALRHAWSRHIKDLRSAREWLGSIGAETRVASHGARLLLPIASERTPPVYVKSSSELQLPSGGPLAEVSLGDPRERRHRPLRSLEHSSELELGISGEMVRLARKNARSAERQAASTSLAEPDGAVIHMPRVLVLDDEAITLAMIEAALAGHGFDVDTFQDASRALASFRRRSYDLVVADARLRRIDGLEFTARLQELAGIEKLPVVLTDDRANSATERAAQAAGASAYIVKPVSWADAGELLADVLDATNWRRFIRYRARLSVEVSVGARIETELTQTVARGGISLRTRRDMLPGSVEHYRIALPRPLPRIEVDAAAVMCLAQPGAATLVAGLRFLRFRGDGETHWIRLIEELARRSANRRRNEPSR